MLRSLARWFSDWRKKRQLVAESRKQPVAMTLYDAESVLDLYRRGKHRNPFICLCLIQLSLPSTKIVGLAEWAERKGWIEHWVEHPFNAAAFHFTASFENLEDVKKRYLSDGSRYTHKFIMHAAVVNRKYLLEKYIEELKANAEQSGDK